jgi:hypothetical protein
MKLSEFEKEISSLILQPIHLPDDGRVIDLSLDEVRYIPPRERIEKEISETLYPKYKEFAEGHEPEEWKEERKQLFAEKDTLKYSTITEEINNCYLKSVGKKKYPFDFFSKASLKEVNYVKAKKPRIEENPEKKQDLVLSIAIYSNGEKKGIKSHSYLVLGSQTLNELADAIYCVNNFSKVSADQDPRSEKNGIYFFFENCFYNKGMISDDTRRQISDEDILLGKQLEQIDDKLRLAKETKQKNSAVEDIHFAEEPNQLDEEIDNLRTMKNQIVKRRIEIYNMLAQYQEPITWLRNKNSGTNYNALSMETTRFRDLNLKIGAQYLYCHAGDCEHVLIVENVRGYSPTIDNYDSFPVLVYQNKIRRLKCSVCKYLPGRIVTTNDEAICENTCLFCEVCFKLLHPDDELLAPEQKKYQKHTYFNDV